MAFMHLMSANINIAIGIVFLIVSYCQLIGREEQGATILKKMVASFISGVLLALGYCICGISKRSLVFKSFDAS
jgi:cytochrome bd-type quinol oxidase subunit 1